MTSVMVWLRVVRRHLARPHLSAHRPLRALVPCLHLCTKFPTLTHTRGAASTIYRRLDLTTPQGAAKYWGDVNNSVCVP